LKILSVHRVACVVVLKLLVEVRFLHIGPRPAVSGKVVQGRFLGIVCRGLFVQQGVTGGRVCKVLSLLIVVWEVKLGSMLD